MIANFFSKTKPINTLAIVSLLFFIYTLSTLTNFSGTLSFSFFLTRLSYFFLLLIILFSVNFIVRKNKLVKDNSYTLLLYVILIGMFPFSVLDFKLAMINFILLLSYRRIYSLRTQKDVKEKLFDSALWIGIATLMYSWSALILLLVFLAAYVFDKWTWRNALVPLIGFFCPIVIYMAYLIAINKPELLESIFSFKLSIDFINYNSFRLLVPLAIVVSLMLWAIFPTTLKIIAVNNEFRSSWQLLITHFFILVLIILPWPNKNGSELLYLFFPMAIIYANYLQMVEENWFKEVFIYSFLALTIVIYFL